MPVYRYYTSPVSGAQISSQVPGSVVVGSSGALSYQDVTVDSGSKADLDEYMASIGWTYLATDPAMSVAEQVAADGLMLANSVPLRGLDTPGGVARDLIAIDAANATTVGNTTYDSVVAGAAVSVRDAANATLAQFSDAGSDGDAALLVLVNRSGVKSVSRVTIGAADSGGAGFRALRVPN